MPREKTPTGAADVVLAFRRADGRVELQCKMSAADAKTLMDQAIEMMKNYKEQAA